METYRMNQEQVIEAGKLMSYEDAKSLKGSRILYTYPAWRYNHQTVHEIVVGDIHIDKFGKFEHHELLDEAGNNTGIFFDPRDPEGDGLMRCSNMGRPVSFLVVEAQEPQDAFEVDRIHGTIYACNRLEDTRCFDFKSWEEGQQTRVFCMAVDPRRLDGWEEADKCVGEYSDRYESWKDANGTYWIFVDKRTK